MGVYHMFDPLYEQVQIVKDNVFWLVNLLIKILKHVLYVFVSLHNVTVM